jgi:hypothetical protein
MGLLLLNSVRHYGNRWEFGQYGMPESLLAADGQHYLDGTAIDPTILHLIQSGYEAEFFLGVVLFVGLMGLLVLRQVWRQQRLRQQIDEYWSRIPVKES